MALFKILKGANADLAKQVKREGFAYFTVDENDFYIDISSDDSANGIVGERKQLNANRAHYVKSKNLHSNSAYDQLYIDDDEISLGRKAGESNYEAPYVPKEYNNDQDPAGLKSIAVGSNVSATGNYSQAFGSNTSAREMNATAFGKGTVATGEASFTIGVDTQATHEGSYAEGIQTLSDGDGSHAEGYLTQANNDYAHAEGSQTIANGYGSHTEGWKTQTGENGSYAHAEGSETQANGYASHAEGNNTIAEKEGAHAEGLGANALGEGSHAEGHHSKAEADYSHAEGDGSAARGIASHAEGEETRAIGIASHAEGKSSRAEGDYSHAGGYGSETGEHEGAFVHGLGLYGQADYQTIFGKYSDADEDEAFILAGGTSDDDRRNLFTIKWDGTASLYDTLTVGRDPLDSFEVATKQYVDRKVLEAGDDNMYSFTTQLTADSSTITFNDDAVDVSKCLIYYNGILLILGENYTVTNEKTVELNGWSGKTGDFFTVTGKQGGDSAAGSLNVGTVGSSTRPVYFLDGVPVACSSDLDYVNISSTYIKGLQLKANSEIPTLQLIKGDDTSVDLELNIITPDAATKDYVDEKCKVSVYGKTAIDGASSIAFDVDVNNFLIYCNGLLLVPGEHYTISGNNTINLIGWTAEADDYFSLVGSPAGVDNTNARMGNDYAEYRAVVTKEPGRCVVEAENGIMQLSTERMQPGAEIISDTFGYSIGKTAEYQTPIAMTGRVLAYPNEDRNSYTLGCAVCSGPNGTISQMTREEIREYPERIIGTVSEIPKYETWGDVAVNGRIWIRIR